jgi:FSR family fosmidomycin resistance protein-like MFS transporter
MSMSETQAPTSLPKAPEAAAEETVMKVLLALSFSHLLNDTIQSLLPAIYPLLKGSYHLSFSQIGLITFVFQLTGSLFQPLVGHYTDKAPKPYSLAVGMGLTLAGLLSLSRADSFGWILGSAAVVGLGSAVFHPEASRMAFMASGGRRGFAQALFQVGGNLGTSLGPLLAALIIAPQGQSSLAWFSLLALLGILVLSRIGGWYARRLARGRATASGKGVAPAHGLSRGRVLAALGVLMVLLFSKYIYLVSLTNYYTFYLIDRFGLEVRGAQLCLFAFLFAVAAGTIIGGPVGDRFGRKYVIWFSILGVAPFSLLLPYASLAWTVVLSVVIGLVLASAFSAMLVYAQELIPGRVGMISGLFFGLAFGVSGIASAALGRLADFIGIDQVFHLCAYLPLLGLVACLLPDIGRRRAR